MKQFKHTKVLFSYFFSCGNVVFPNFSKVFLGRTEPFLTLGRPFPAISDKKKTDGENGIKCMCICIVVSELTRQHVPLVCGRLNDDYLSYSYFVFRLFAVHSANRAPTVPRSKKISTNGNLSAQKQRLTDGIEQRITLNTCYLVLLVLIAKKGCSP